MGVSVTLEKLARDNIKSRKGLRHRPGPIAFLFAVWLARLGSGNCWRSPRHGFLPSMQHARPRSDLDGLAWPAGEPAYNLDACVASRCTADTLHNTNGLVVMKDESDSWTPSRRSAVYHDFTQRHLPLQG